MIMDSSVGVGQSFHTEQLCFIIAMLAIGLYLGIFASCFLFVVHHAREHIPPYSPTVVAVVSFVSLVFVPPPQLLLFSSSSYAGCDLSYHQALLLACMQRA